MSFEWWSQRRLLIFKKGQRRIYVRELGYLEVYTEWDQCQICFPFTVKRILKNTKKLGQTTLVVYTLAHKGKIQIVCVYIVADVYSYKVFYSHCFYCGRYAWLEHIK